MLTHLPSTDLFIGIFFLIGIGYGFLIQRDRTITALCSTYMGLVIANFFAKDVFEFINGNKTIADAVWIRGNASISTIQIVLFCLVILMVTKAIHAAKKKSEDLSVMEIVVYSALTTGIVITSILGFLPEVTRQSLIEGSKVATTLFNLKSIFLVLPPIILFLLNLRKNQ